jgi:hypothetical protein
MTDQCPLQMTTNLILGAVTLTGSTIRAASTPSLCYHLPTSTSDLQMVAVRDPIAPPELSNILFLYMSNSSDVPYYVGAYVNGLRYLVDVSGMSDPFDLGVVLPGGGSMAIAGDTISLFSPTCTSVTSITIANFLQQLVSFPRGLIGRQNEKLQKRVSHNFTVFVEIDSDIDNDEFKPTMSFGAGSCDFFSLDFGAMFNTWSWNCQFPGIGSPKAECQALLSSMLDPYPNTTRGAEPFNLLAYLAPFLGTSADQIAGLFPLTSPPLSIALDWLGRAFSKTKAALQYGSESICDIVHANETYELVVQDGGPFGTHTIGNFGNVPPTSILVDLATASPNAATSQEPPRQVAPNATLTTETVSTYPPTMTLSLSSSTIVVAESMTSILRVLSVVNGVGSLGAGVLLPSSSTGSAAASTVTSSHSFLMSTHATTGESSHSSTSVSVSTSPVAPSVQPFITFAESASVIELLNTHSTIQQSEATTPLLSLIDAQAPSFNLPDLSQVAIFTAALISEVSPLLPAASETSFDRTELQPSMQSAPNTTRAKLQSAAEVITVNLPGSTAEGEPILTAT